MLVLNTISEFVHDLIVSTCCTYGLENAHSDMPKGLAFNRKFHTLIVST